MSLINNIKSVTTLKNNKLKQNYNIQHYFVLIFSIVLIILIIFLVFAFVYINKKIKTIYIDFCILQNIYFNKLFANFKTVNQEISEFDKKKSPAIMPELNDQEVTEELQKIYQNSKFEGVVDVHVGMDRVEYHRSEDIAPASLYSEQTIFPFTGTNYSESSNSSFEKTDNFDSEHVYSEPSNL